MGGVVIVIGTLYELPCPLVCTCLSIINESPQITVDQIKRLFYVDTTIRKIMSSKQVGVLPTCSFVSPQPPGNPLKLSPLYLSTTKKQP